MGASKHIDTSKHMGVSKHTGGIQIYGESLNIQTYRGIQIWGCPNMQGACKHMGVIKHTGGHPNIWGMSKYTGWFTLLYLHNTKKACFVRLMGCPDAPIHLGTPCLDGPLYVWMPPYVWIPPVCLDAPQYVWMPLNVWGHENVWVI